MAAVRAAADELESVVADDQVRKRLRLGAAQRVGLRFTAPLGYGLGEVREEHREPKPDRDREIEPGRPMTKQIAHEEDQRDQRADFANEHHRIAILPARIELCERLDDRTTQDLAIEEGACFRTTLYPPLRDHLKRLSL